MCSHASIYCWCRTRNHWIQSHTSTVQWHVDNTCCTRRRFVMRIKRALPIRYKNNLQVPVPGRHSLGDDSEHRLVRLICSPRHCGELSISAHQGEWTCASLPDGAGRVCQETSLKISILLYLEVLFHKLWVSCSNPRAETNHSQILWCQEPSGEQKAFANTFVDALTLTGERELLRSGIQTVGPTCCQRKWNSRQLAALVHLFGTHHR